jgi:hypothetical protein
MIERLIDSVILIELTTRNTKDFNPQHHDFVEIPYAI